MMLGFMSNREAGAFLVSFVVLSVLAGSANVEDRSLIVRRMVAIRLQKTCLEFK
jgi:hypothetical protein